MSYKKTIRERLEDGFIGLFMLIVLVATLYPFIYVLSLSLSAPREVAQMNVWLWPKGFSIEAYKTVMVNAEFYRAYGNTIWYTAVGTAVNVLLTVLAGFTLARKQFSARNIIMVLIAFTMFFSGGLIPEYLLVKNLGLYDTRWAIILPSAASAFFIIIARTFFQGIPESLYESAYIDGANDIQILQKVAFPLSKPIVAVLALFYAVNHWNSYFPSLIYLSSVDLQPVQLYLMKLLIEENNSSLLGSISGYERVLQAMQIKYAAIIVVIAPIVCVYPYLQRYFVKGIMIGSIKG